VLQQEARSKPIAEIAGALDEKPLVRNPLSVELTPRLLLPLLAGVLVVALGEPTVISLTTGLALVAGGEAVRLWAAGHLYKTRELVASGPYAWIRHPLYAGTLLIGCGFLVAGAGTIGPIGLPCYLLFFFGYYLPYKTRKEDGRLARRHADYAAYRALVPSILPWRGRFTPDAERPPRSWSLARLRDNDELGIAVLVLSVALVLTIEVAV
jgi:protein-S-isoprenylcysteine O-methyltransferase Ste14